jgi:hypothetical protein
MSGVENKAPSTVFAKAIALVFLAGFTIVTLMMANSARSSGSAFESPMPGVGRTPQHFGPGGVFVAVPIFLAVIGVMMFIGVLISPVRKSPRQEQPDLDSSGQSRGDLDDRPSSPPQPDFPSGNQQIPACPGCGSRKNAPGASACGYCGSGLRSAQ